MEQEFGLDLGRLSLLNKKFGTIMSTDYRRPERKYFSLHGQKFNLNPKF